MITLAVQKSGRLSEQTNALLKECGIKFNYNGKGKLKSTARNFPLQTLYLRDDDIPECVNDGIADIGIVGENTLLEKGFKLSIAERLGFARCRLSLAVPQQVQWKSLDDLGGMKIATSYPRILKRFLDRHDLKAEIHEISGSVEIAPGIGLGDAIFDIVSTGSTLMTNGLKEVYTVLESEAVMVQAPQLDGGKLKLIDRLLFRLRAVQRASSHKYIILNAPNDKLDEICALLPGMKSPTITPLATSGWSSLYSVIREDEFWENIDKLKSAGAQGILVVPIEKMIL